MNETSTPRAISHRAGEPFLVQESGDTRPAGQGGSRAGEASFQFQAQSFRPPAGVPFPESAEDIPDFGWE
ncbi:MAG: hypothetical protein D6793_08945 [Thermoflexia bacterium]|nr:MAG: hypothetical protein D6793_08945 [Thermoflexia bacterium]